MSTPTGQPETPAPDRNGSAHTVNTPSYDWEADANAPQQLPPEIPVERPAAGELDPARWGREDEPERPTQRQPKAPAQPKHSPRAVELALKLGATQAQIDATDPDALKAWVRSQTDLLIADARGQRRQQTPTVPPPPPAPAPLPGTSELDAMKEFIDEEAYGPLRKVFESQAAYIRRLEEKLDGLAPRLETAEKYVEHRRQLETLDQVDAVFTRLGADAAFGKGRRDEIDPAHLARRSAVLTHATALAAGQPLTEKHIAEAARVLFAVKPRGEQPGRQPPQRNDRGQFRPREEADEFTDDRITPERWNAAGLARPNGRTAPEPAERGDLAAKRAIAQQMADRGEFVPDFEGGTSEDDFLG